jgi:cyclophilin family peptidyl-prolyl cis-trans isomerase
MMTMFKRSAGNRLRTDRAPASLMESLENRVMFGVGSTPFPTLDMLQNPNDTVVRFQTSMGDVDIELFDTDAPVTVANFLHYVRDGDYDQSFFHRLAFSGANPFVLQGGGFRFDNATSTAFNAIPTDAPITNEASAMRPNATRTIAMARTNDPNSATDQFFFNLANNTNLNPSGNNPGYAVFGKVVNDASWNVILAIQGLNRSNMDSASEFQAFAGNFGTVPTTTPWTSGNPVPVTEGLLVRINDAEIIKPGNVQAFYNVQVYYPEGFTGSTISEFLPLGNPGQSTLNYQVIVRAEVPHGNITTTDGWFRDRVIDTGSIAAHTRGGITISQFGEGGQPGANDKVPQGVPYAIEVWSTADIAANLSHYDFGTSTGEAFTPVFDTSWSFGEGAKLNGSIFDFLVWDNPNKTDAHLTVTFFFQSSNPITLDVTTDAFRRGGLAFANVAQLADNSIFSARIQSDVPIIAALSHYDNRGSQNGSTALGIPGNSSREGVLPFGQGGPDIDSMKVSFFNPSSTPSVVTIRLRFENPELDLQPGGATLVIPGNRRMTLDIDTLLNTRIVAGDPFTVYYTTGSTAGVYAHGSVVALDDVVSNPFGVSVANTWVYAEGFMDPARAGDSVIETLSVYNPNSVTFTGTNTTANITFTFLYTDGFTLTHNAQIAGGGRLDLNVDGFQDVLDQGTMHNRFFYSVRIDSDVPIFGEMIHYDTNLGGLQASGGFSTLGTPLGVVTRLEDL